jgi:hypothetical protein
MPIVHIVLFEFLPTASIAEVQDVSECFYGSNTSDIDRGSRHAIEC